MNWHFQALSSVGGGYDLLAPKFGYTPFRTCDGVLDATAGALRPFGPFGRGLDVCCGTGAGMRVLGSLSREPVTGADVGAGMLAQARSAHPDARWVRADVRALPFAGVLDWVLVASMATMAVALATCGDSVRGGGENASTHPASGIWVSPTVGAENISGHPGPPVPPPPAPNSTPPVPLPAGQKSTVANVEVVVRGGCWQDANLGNLYGAYDQEFLVAR